MTDSSNEATIDLNQLFGLDEFESLAMKRMTVAARDLCQEGAGKGSAVRANSTAWKQWALRARVLRDVSQRDLSTSVLGTRVSLPLLIAPSGLHGLVHSEAEVATARAARSSGTLMVLAMNSSLSVEQVAAEGAKLWFQLYWGVERDFLVDIMARAASAGCKAFCLTIDMPVRPWILGPMRRMLSVVGDVRPAHGFPRSGHLALQARWDHDARLTWNDLAWLRVRSALPIVLKGIMTAEDAVLAADHGADAIIVSNHGGRMLEEGFATAEVLPSIAASVGRRLEIFVDGGIRTGSDVAKALALGARAALIGRPALWGLAVGGAAGVERVLGLVREELQSVMGMIGAASADDVDASTIARRGPV
jgi:isopentenyl diphosphate isomerase/L-lactate dehydrogenase-like FMN-dependent dehydrogenase